MRDAHGQNRPLAGAVPGGPAVGAAGAGGAIVIAWLSHPWTLGLCAVVAAAGLLGFLKDARRWRACLAVCAVAAVPWVAVLASVFR
jgi:hypothetical protein